MTLGAVVSKLRKRMIEYRWHTRFETSMHQAADYIEIALNLAELSIVQSRPVTPEEEVWFHEGWPVVHSLEDTEWEDIIDLYRTLTFKLSERNWMRV
ncbi:MAG TPA: hypothetical protein PKL06_13505 [Chitinophagales bacterium]|nr:hypothetical protein [Chitinophagales bacterium]